MGGPLGGPASTVPRFVRVASARSRNYSGIVPAEQCEDERQRSDHSKWLTSGPRHRAQSSAGARRRDGGNGNASGPGSAALRNSLFFGGRANLFFSPPDYISDMSARARVIGVYIIFHPPEV